MRKKNKKIDQCTTQPSTAGNVLLGMFCDLHLLSHLSRITAPQENFLFG